MSRTPTSKVTKTKVTKPLTLQQVFDKVSVALLKQNKRSGVKGKNGAFQCQYRGDNGLKCAIGHLIPNVAYSLDMETRGPEIVLKLAEVFLTEECYSASVPLHKLQMVHDHNKPSRWSAKLRAFAKKYGLSHDKMDTYLKKLVANVTQ